MANVKFSAFTANSDVNTFEGLVGYNTTGSLNLKIQPKEMPSRYDLAVNNIAFGNGNTLGGTNIGAAGARNVALGIDSMNTVNTLVDSLSIGYESLFNIVDTGTVGTGQNIAIGNYTQYLNGDAVLGSGTSGDENVAIGYEALYSNTGEDGVGTFLGSYNVAIGTDALFLLDTGDTNTALGHNSGSGMTNGYGNTLIGFESGMRPATLPAPNFLMTTESNSVVIGNRTATQGSFGVTIGDFSYASTGLAAPDYAVVVGYNSNVNAPTSILIGSFSSIDSQSERDIVIGRFTTLTTVGGLNTVIGSDSAVVGNYNTHVGWLGNLTGDDNCSVGNSQDIYGNDNVVLGDTTVIGTPAPGISSNNVAVGAGITIPGLVTNCYVIGAGVTAGVSNSFNVGFGGTGTPGSATIDIQLVGQTSGSGNSFINLAGSLDFNSDLVKYNGQVACAYTDQGAVVANQSPDWSNGNIQKFTLSANINIDAPVVGTVQPGTYILILEQGAGAPYTIGSWNAVYKWTAASGAPTLSGAPGDVDIITFVCDGTNFYGSALYRFI